MPQRHRCSCRSTRLQRTRGRNPKNLIPPALTSEPTPSIITPSIQLHLILHTPSPSPSPFPCPSLHASPPVCATGAAWDLQRQGRCTRRRCNRRATQSQGESKEEGPSARCHRPPSSQARLRSAGDGVMPRRPLALTASRPVDIVLVSMSCLHRGAASIHRAVSSEEQRHSTEPHPQGGSDIPRAASIEEQRRSTELQSQRSSVSPQGCIHRGAASQRQWTELHVQKSSVNPQSCIHRGAAAIHRCDCQHWFCESALYVKSAFLSVLDIASWALSSMPIRTGGCARSMPRNIAMCMAEVCSTFTPGEFLPKVSLGTGI